MEEQRFVFCGERTITYTLVRKKVKNINMRIKPDGSIFVSANRRISSTVTDEFIRQNQAYIFRALDRFKEHQNSIILKPEQYISGESISILGKRLCLEVIESEREEVYMDGDFLYILVRNKDDFRRKEKLMGIWLKKLQIEIFEKICRDVYPGFQKLHIEYPQIKIRKMKARWGSCQPQRGIITLNSRLIAVPYACIEYVVLHEFAHLIHPNHSKAFYDFVAERMPDWKERKEALNTWY